MFELDSNTYPTSWLLISTTKELSNHNELFSLYPSSFDIYLNDGLSSRYEDNDGNQNTLSPYGQLYDNADIY